MKRAFASEYAVAEFSLRTLNTAWGTLKVELENMAQGFHVMAEEVVFKAKGPVELHLKETAKSRRKVRFGRVLSSHSVEMRCSAWCVGMKWPCLIDADHGNRKEADQ